MTNWNMRVIYWLILIQIIFCLTIVIGSFFKQDTGREVGFCYSFLGFNAVALLNLLQVQKQMKAEQIPAAAPEPTEPTPPDDE